LSVSCSLFVEKIFVASTLYPIFVRAISVSEGRELITVEAVFNSSVISTSKLGGGVLKASSFVSVTSKDGELSDSLNFERSLNSNLIQNNEII
jgi:hypothetical protein